MEVKVHVWSAFCKDNSGGNKAGIVLFEEKLNEAQKKAIANEMGYSETVFVAKSAITDFKLEYFTPAEEVPLCGHATIAAFALMQNLNMLGKAEYSFETKAGVFTVEVDGGMIFMEQARPQYFEIIDPQDLAKCFDISLIAKQYPIQIVSTGLRDILVPIRDERSLNGLVPNFDEISKISRKYDAVGIHAFSLHEGKITCRNFAPLYDIPEESATGTANCALASYLYKHGIARQNEFIIGQGYSLNSPSEIAVRVDGNGEEVSRIFVGGRGCFVGERSVGLGTYVSNQALN